MDPEASSGGQGWLARRVWRWTEQKTPPEALDARRHFDAMRAATDADVRRAEADRAVHAYQQVWALDTANGVSPPPLTFGRLAVASFEAGSMTDAVKFANMALEYAKRGKDRSPLSMHMFNQAEAWLVGHEVLGRVALREGEVRRAVAHLGSAFDLGDNPMGMPHFDLARELVESGETGPVLLYLDRCARVRRYRRLSLAAWKRDVQHGTVPEGWRR